MDKSEKAKLARASLAKMEQAEKVKLARAKMANKFKGINTRLGGKGTQKRKVKKTDKGNMSSSKKLKAIEKKLGTAPLPDIAEVNLFREDGDVWHFSNPNVRGSIQNQVLVVSQEPELKNLKNNFAEFISHLGPKDLGKLKDIIGEEAKNKEASKEPAAKKEPEEEAPELVNFEDYANN